MPFTLFLTVWVQLWTEMKCNIATLNVTVWAVGHRERIGLWGDKEQLAPNPQVQWKAHHRLVWAERGHCQPPLAGMRSTGSGLQRALTLHPESLPDATNLQAAGWFIKEGEAIKYMTNGKGTKQKATMWTSGESQIGKTESLFPRWWHSCRLRPFLLWKTSLIIAVKTPDAPSTNEAWAACARRGHFSFWCPC